MIPTAVRWDHGRWDHGRMLPGHRYLRDCDNKDESGPVIGSEILEIESGGKKKATYEGHVGIICISVFSVSLYLHCVH